MLIPEPPAWTWHGRSLIHNTHTHIQKETRFYTIIIVIIAWWWWLPPSQEADSCSNTFFAHKFFFAGLTSSFLLWYYYITILYPFEWCFIKVLTSMMTRPTGWLSATMSKNTRGRPIFSVFLLAKFRTLRCTNDDWIRIGGDEFANRATAAVDRLNSSVAEAILDWRIVCEVNWARARQRGQNDGVNLVVE